MVKRQKKSRIVATLEESLAEQLPVDVWHEADDEPMGAVVLAIGDRWILFSQLIDGVIPNGYRIVRRSMIRRAKVLPLFQAYLRDQGIVPPPHPEIAVNLDGTREVLQSVAAKRKAFSVHRDDISPNGYLLGAPVEWKRRSFWLLPIDPKARWEHDMTKIRFRDVTQVTFGSAYESAIVATAGPLPKRSSESRESI